MKDNAPDSGRMEVVRSGPALKAEGIELTMGARWRMREGARLPGKRWAATAKHA